MQFQIKSHVAMCTSSSVAVLQNIHITKQNGNDGYVSVTQGQTLIKTVKRW